MSKEFKTEYFKLLSEKGIPQYSEAIKLDLAPKTINNYLNPEEKNHLPAYLVPKSLVACGLMQHLAEECGGVFIQLEGFCNGDDSDEMQAIGTAYAKLYKEKNFKRRQHLLKVIEINVAAILKNRV